MNTNEDVQSIARRQREVESELSGIWSEVLGIPAGSIKPDANFFSLGGDSVLIARVAERVAACFFPGRPDDALGIAELFSHATLRALARRLLPALTPMASAQTDSAHLDEASVAIIGMACRFPGAADIGTFWRNLCDGVESIRAFSDTELLEAGVSAADLRHAGYVKAGVLLEGVRLFDAEYFGLTAREASLTSPEQRLLIECAEEALQHAGHGDCGRPARVGVFVGTGLSTYLIELLAANDPDLESSHGMALLASNTCAATRISYVLNLTGPSLTIDTACSSSLVAIHEASQAILRGECAMALAGGATVRRFAPRGYFAEPGGIFSPDGHCHPFDRLAQGTVSSSGAGMVLLKRLSDALADGDPIHAVIRGTAINNDGGEKAGYTAPSAAGQAGVLRAALTAARVDAATIQYLETHGTATALGDLIELSALSSVFASVGSSANRPKLGTLKANLGHMEAAAGIGGLIKAVLVLKNRQVPPAIRFHEWAAALGTPPFELSSRLLDWSASDVPRRAGVSAFGVGGTNAHAVLEEAPLLPSGTSTRRAHLLVISAGSDAALRESCRRLSACLRAGPPGTLADIAYTLQVGRKQFRHRRYVVASSITEAVQALETVSADVPFEPRSAAHTPLVFIFPGAAAQNIGMYLSLYESEPQFRRHLDECARLLRPLLRRDLLQFVRVPANEPGQTECFQSALFALQYSLGQLWLSWGMTPSAMIGHGVGEYVAACIAGLFTLGDALKVVAARGTLMQQMPVRDLGEFTAVLRSVAWGEIRIPYVSTLTGQAVARDTAACPEHWISHLREPDQLSAGVRSLSQGSPRIFLEMGQGSVLSDLVRGEQDWQAFSVLAPLSREGAEADGYTALVNALGGIWKAGATVDWRAFNGSLAFRRVPLPAYPFERREHWIASRTPAIPVRPQSGGGRLEMSDWFNVPVWEQKPLLRSSQLAPSYGVPEAGCWLILGGSQALQSAFGERLASVRTRVVCVSSADRYARNGNRFTVCPRDPAALVRVFEALEQDGTPVSSFIHCAETIGVADVDERPEPAGLESGLYSLLDLCTALASLRRRPARLVVVTRGAYAIADEAFASPRRAMLAAAMAVVAKEFPDVCCRAVDIPPGPAKRGRAEEAAVDALVAQIISTSSDALVAIRGAHPWVRNYRRVQLPGCDPEHSLLRPGGVYLVTGGLGGIGWTLAEFLARELRARLILVGRSSFPNRSDWLGLLAARPGDDRDCRRIRDIQSLEAAGARVLTVSANVACLDDMRRVVALAAGEFGHLNGVIHAAGVAGAGALHCKSREQVAEVLVPKVIGTWALHEACRSLEPDFFACCSSIAAVISPAGWYEYSAANAFQDAFCEAHDGGSRTRFLSINWDGWRETGMAVKALSASAPDAERSKALASGISPPEGVEVFKRVLSNPGARWIISTRGLDGYLSSDRIGLVPPMSAKAPADSGAREGLARSDASPSLPTIQAQVASIWRDLLGVESIEVDDDFFSRGGDSLLAVELRTRLDTQFGRSPALRELLACPTLGAMAQLLQETA